ncbi:ammonium transporter [Endozoicomonas euniceicola]|uniref:Ammonium transporter n=1 Tax=Endozoicomonas euniceicola TaxID=1234143 RepID=A0ABY6GSM5_9GAMM|nr:ammonium transporter [Endozoicomonas euniceicola]UYM15756.1 ammonium transporter [Endozoicomonas euniceicola]
MPYGTQNTLFMILCTLLVLLMQAGFLCLEAGAVRSKNTVNVAAKNLIDLILVTVLYFAFGFTIQYGWFSDFSLNAHPNAPHYPYLFLLFQALFAVTTATIVSGAVAERCSLTGYIIISLVIVSVIYPISGQWVWGGVFGTPEGWLAKLGFIDFAGSTQVHALGGAVALASVLIIGPRNGFHDQSYKVFRGQNQTLSLLGVMLLWVGWFGFNMGSMLKVDVLLGLIMFNTFISACAGGLASLVWSLVFYHKADIPIVANGVLAGLVGITAGVHAVQPAEAILIGVVSGLICCGATVYLEHRKIDDVISAIPVHLAAGIWGSLAVALLGDPEILNTGHDLIAQFGIQLLGTACIVAWSFGVSFILLKLLNRWFPLRVSAESERVGLNISEHDAITELSDIVHNLEQQSESGDFHPLEHHPFSELAGITQQYNRILTSFLRSQNELQSSLDTLQTTHSKLMLKKAEADSANRQKTLLISKVSREIRTPLNGIIVTSEMLNMEPLPAEQKQWLEIITQSGNALMDIVHDVIDYSRLEAGNLSLQHSTFQLSELMDQCKKVFLTEAFNKNLEFLVQIEMGTPKALTADSQRLRQIIINLLGNAFRYTDKGTITLSAQMEHTTGRLLLEVKDTGAGISEDSLEKAFDAFGLEEKYADREANNSGLSLTICRQLAELMGGTISVKSQPGEGSHFTLQIPVKWENKEFR